MRLKSWNGKEKDRKEGKLKAKLKEIKRKTTKETEIE